MTNGGNAIKDTLRTKKSGARRFIIAAINRKVEELMHANPIITKGELCEQAGCSEYTLNNIYMRVKREVCARSK